MNVAELLHKLRVITNVEIVVSLLPEMLGDGWPIQARFWLEWVALNQTSRDSLLQRFDCICEGVRLRFTAPVEIPTQAKIRLEWATILFTTLSRFAQQQVNMLGHDHVAVNAQSVTATHSLQGYLESSAACISDKQMTAMVTAESDEMTLTAPLKTCQSPRHGDNLVSCASRVCDG